jgi:hypothetical protein
VFLLAKFHEKVKLIFFFKLEKKSEILRVSITRSENNNNNKNNDDDDENCQIFIFGFRYVPKNMERQIMTHVV